MYTCPYPKAHLDFFPTAGNSDFLLLK
jgi:hypothetical protein